MNKRTRQPDDDFASDYYSKDHDIVPPPRAAQLHNNAERDTVRMSEIQSLPNDSWKAPEGQLPFLVIAEYDLELREPKVAMLSRSASKKPWWCGHQPLSALRW
jgi:hypothetical protein